MTDEKIELLQAQFIDNLNMDNKRNKLVIERIEKLEKKIGELSKCKQDSMYNHVFSCSYSDKMRVQLKKLKHEYHNQHKYISSLIKGNNAMHKRIAELEKIDIRAIEHNLKAKVEALGKIHANDIGYLQTHIKELKQIFEIHSKDTMSHHDVDKELVGLVKKNEELEQKFSAVIKEHIELHIFNTAMVATDKDEYLNTLKGLLDKLDGRVERVLPEPSWVDEITEGEPSSHPWQCTDYDYCKKHFGDTTTTTYIKCPLKTCPYFDEFSKLFKEEQEYETVTDPITHVTVQLKKEAKVITIDEAKKNLTEFIKQVKQEEKEFNEEAEPSEFNNVVDAYELKECVKDGKWNTMIRILKSIIKREVKAKPMKIYPVFSDDRENELIAEFLKGWRQFTEWIKKQKREILSAGSIIEEIEKYEKEWEGRRKE